MGRVEATDAPHMPFHSPSDTSYAPPEMLVAQVAVASPRTAYPQCGAQLPPCGIAPPVHVPSLACSGSGESGQVATEGLLRLT